MKLVNRIGVLSAYEPSFSESGRSRTRDAMQSALSVCGWQAGRDYALSHHHSDLLEAHRQAITRWLSNKEIDLLFIGGTPIAWIARQAMTECGVHVPLVYFGAHPIDGAHEVGKQQIRERDTVCVRMKLPLTFSHRTFRLLKSLFPNLVRISIPFAYGTVFCHSEMTARYDRLRNRFGSDVWAEGEQVGYQSIQNLCWLIDASYREYPLVDEPSLAAALRKIPSRRKNDPVTDVIVAFNDTYHVAGAPSRLLAFSRESLVPVIWVNNALMARRGALADFCNPFEDVAAQASVYVAQFLEGQWPSGRYDCVWNEKEVYTLNRATAQTLGVPTAGWDPFVRHFHEVLL